MAESMHQHFSRQYTEVANALNPDNVGKQFLFVGAREFVVGTLQRIEGREIVVAYHIPGIVEERTFRTYPAHFSLYKLSDIMNNEHNQMERRALRRGGTKKYKKSRR